MPVRGYGLLWTEWKRTYKAVGVGLTLQTAMVSAIIWRYLTTGDGRGGAASFWCPVIAICVSLVLLVSQSSSRDIRFAVPRRYFLLPISTVRMVSWLFFYRLAVLLVTAAPAVVLHVLTTQRNDAWLIPLTGFAVAFSLLQALVWVAPWLGTRTTYALALFVLGPAAAVICQRYNLFLSGYTARTIVFGFLSLAASFVLSCLAIHSLRSGKCMRGDRTPFVTLLLGLGSSRTRPFATGTQAWSWFEWRTAYATPTFFFSGLLLAMNCLLAIGAYLEVASGSPPHFEQQWIHGLFLLLCTAVMASIWTGTRRVLPSWQKSSNFPNRYPLDDIDLARGKIVGVAYAVLTWSAVMAGGSLAATALVQRVCFDSFAFVVPQDPLWVFLPSVLVFTWIAYWAGWLIVLINVITLFAAWETEHLVPATAPYADTISTHAFLLAVVLSAGLATPSFVKVHKHALLSVRTLCLLTLTIAGGSCMGVYCFRSSELFRQFGSLELWVLCGALSLLAVSPFAAMPLTIFRARHR